jgi:hypothetical protein
MTKTRIHYTSPLTEGVRHSHSRIDFVTKIQYEYSIKRASGRGRANFKRHEGEGQAKKRGRANFKRHESGGRAKKWATAKGAQAKVPELPRVMEETEDGPAILMAFVNLAGGSPKRKDGVAG